METCLIVMLGLIWAAYRLDCREHEKALVDAQAHSAEGWDHAAKRAGEMVRLERRLEMCRADLKRAIRERAAARGKATKLKKRVAELEGGQPGGQSLPKRGRS